MKRSAAAPLLVAGLLLLSLTAWLAMLALAWRSYFGMVPATGVIASLADAILRGQAPGHDDGRTLLATFYLPPFPALVALAHRVGLDWLGALRVSSVATALLLAAAGGWLASALGAGRRGVVLAVALILATNTFKTSSLGGRADPLAAAFAIAGLAAWRRDAAARGWGLPAFAAGALLTKATSVTLPLAVLWWAFRRRDGGALLRFGVRFVACAAVGVLITLPIHGPQWYADTFRSLMVATPSTFNSLRGPAELVRYLGAYSELAVFAAMALAFALGGAGRGTPLPAFFGASLLLVVLVMTNFGAGPNHLDEITCATAVGAAAWAAPRLGRAWLPALLLGLVVAGSAWRDLVPVARWASYPTNTRVDAIDAVRREPGEVLTEDALLSLAAGRRSEISDPGALRSMSLSGDPRALRVVERIQEARYSLVVVNEDLDQSEKWYRTVHLGILTTNALRARYREVAIVDGYHLLRPVQSPSTR